LNSRITFSWITHSSINRCLCHTLLIAVAAGSLSMMTACRRESIPTDGFSVVQQFTPQPARIGPETITIRLADAFAQPASGAAITVEADMAHPGMSPVFANASEQKPGSYQATVNFNMPGDWVVLTHITLPNGKRLERQISVKGVPSN
jgi:hypothetical protein